MASWRDLLLVIGMAAMLTTAARASTAADADIGTPPAKPQVILDRLVGTSWRAKTIAGRPVADTVASTLTFLSAVQIGGRGGCNSYGGPVSTAGGRLRLGPLIRTLRACLPPSVMRQEDRFFAVLEAAVRLSFDGPVLLLHAPSLGPPTRLRRIGKAFGG